MRISVLGVGVLLGGLLCAAMGWAQNISRTEVEQVLDVRLRAALEEAGTGLRLVILVHRTDLELPEGTVSLVWNLDVAELGPGRHTLPVAVWVDGVSVRKTRVVVTLEQRVRTPVLRRSLRRGDTVVNADVRMREVVLTRAVPGRIREIRGVVGMVATRSLREDRPLVDKWFESPLAVDRGDLVRIRLVRGALKIETTGVALQRGWVGDLISVRNPQSRLHYEAQITAPGEARVQAW